MSESQCFDRWQRKIHLSGTISTEMEADQNQEEEATGDGVPVTPLNITEIKTENELVAVNDALLHTCDEVCGERERERKRERARARERERERERENDHVAVNDSLLHTCDKVCGERERERERENDRVAINNVLLHTCNEVCACACVC